MSLTALGFVTLFAGFLGLAFVRHPIWGLHAYMLAFYMGPDAAWWGERLPNLRWLLAAASLTLVAAAIRPAVQGRVPWHRHESIRALIAFAGWLWVQTAWALSFDDHVFLATLFTKYVLMFVLVYAVLDSREAIHQFVIAHILGCFYWGYLAWQNPGGGRLEDIGTADVAGSAFASMHVSTALAVAGFLFVTFSGWKRWLPLVATPFILNAIILMQTRGAFVGLLAAAPAALFLAPQARRRAVGAALLVGGLLLFALANDLFWERMGTIRPGADAPMEASAASRLEIARGNWRMFRDHPMGVGHRGNDLLSPEYLPEALLTEKEGSRVRSAHNTELAILVDHGIVGLLLIVVFHARIARSILQLRRRAAEESAAEALGLAAGLGTALVIYWFNGQFANMLKAEVVIWIAATTAAIQALPQLQKQATVPSQQRPRETGTVPLSRAASGRAASSVPPNWRG